jgi:protein-L-isoaspartate O-methyltransferase
MFERKEGAGASFDASAGDYDLSRPGYPASLFKDLKRECGIDKRSRLLEIGVGNGIATTQLAKLGGSIVAIEPGVHLADMAKARLQKQKNVEVVTTTFEDFRSPAKFNAILAFTAFHWLDKDSKYQRIADLLEDSGYLVLVWNSFFQSDSPAMVEINKAHQEFLPTLYQAESTAATVNQGVLAKLNGREQEVISSPLFYTVLLRRYLTVYKYDAETYPKLLKTFPNIGSAGEETCSRFLERVAEVVRQHGEISVPVLTTMLVCAKKNHLLELTAKS